MELTPANTSLRCLLSSLAISNAPDVERIMSLPCLLAMAALFAVARLGWLTC
jgi:hypothetical protein